MKHANENLIVALPVYENDNMTENEKRIDFLIVRISCHEHHIAHMLDIAATIQDSRQRNKLATEIGYSRIEINCILRPELERLQTCR